MGRRQRNVPRVKPPPRVAAAPPLLPTQSDAASLRRWRQYWLQEPLTGMGEFAVYYLFRCLPVGLCSSIGALRGRYLGRARKEAEARARHALALVAPELRPDQVDQLLARLHRNAGRALLETLVMDRIWEGRRVDVVPAERRLQLETHPISRIFVSVHTGNLGDLLGMCLMRIARSSSGMTISRRLPNRFRQRLSEKLRGKHGAEILEPGLKATRQLIAHLRKPGGSILIHLDEARSRQIYFPTFGRPLPYGSNLSLAIRLSAATGAPLVPVYLQRRNGARFQLHVLDDLEIPVVGHDEQHIALAHQLDALFSKIIQQQLEDWQQLYFLRPERQCHPSLSS